MMISVEAKDLDIGQGLRVGGYSLENQLLTGGLMF